MTFRAVSLVNGGVSSLHALKLGLFVFYFIYLLIWLFFNFFSVYFSWFVRCGRTHALN